MERKTKRTPAANTSSGRRLATAASEAYTTRTSGRVASSRSDVHQVHGKPVRSYGARNASISSNTKAVSHAAHGLGTSRISKGLSGKRASQQNSQKTKQARTSRVQTAERKNTSLETPAKPSRAQAHSHACTASPVRSAAYRGARTRSSRDVSLRAKSAPVKARHASVQEKNTTSRQSVSTRADAQQTISKRVRTEGSAPKKTARRSSKRGIVAAVACLIALFFLADHVMNFNKAYAGVHIGSVDCSGKTVDQIVALLDETYANYEEKEVLVYASDEAKRRVEETGERETGEEDRLSVDEAREQRLVWAVRPETVSASFDKQTTAQAAVNEAHGLGKLLDRISAAIQGREIDPVFQFGDAYQDFVDDVNATVGVERIDYNISVNQGICTVTAGQDGILMNDAAFQKDLAYGFLSQQETTPSFVAIPEAAPVRITQNAAQAVCATVNAAIADGANFVYEDAGWNATASSLGAWISSKIEQKDGQWQLVPYVNVDSSRPDLLSHIKTNSGEDPVQVSFTIADAGAVTVKTDASGKIPLVDEAIETLDIALFGSDDQAAQEGAQSADGVAVTVDIASADTPEEMSLDDALYYGVVGEISSFTTSYTYGSATTEARNFNIHLAADLLNNSVCPAGGSWSFHNVAGECNEERGFKEAGVIEEGVYSTAFGGGICQVATTVFNAAYEAGYYIDRRYNHTIYNSSYPAGRDAAVSWPDLDLIWSNDTFSDILMTTSYTEGTITVTLWGVSPERTVSTYVSDWEAGDEYKTKYVLNESMAPTAYRVKTKGSDGRTIYVERAVYDKEGTRLSFQRFSSVYDAVDEVIEHGKDYDVPEDDDKEKKD